MNLLRTQGVVCRTAVMAVIFFGFAWSIVVCDDAVAPHIDVRVEDVPEKVRLIGRLGVPLGTPITIQGEWRKPNPLAKDISPRFFVTSIDGVPSKSEVRFLKGQVEPVMSGRRGRSFDKDAEWTWTFDWREHDPPPEMPVGQSWEMRVAEFATIDAYTSELWRELGGARVATRPRSGFIDTRLEFFKVRLSEK